MINNCLDYCSYKTVTWSLLLLNVTLEKQLARCKTRLQQFCHVTIKNIYLFCWNFFFHITDQHKVKQNCKGDVDWNMTFFFLSQKKDKNTKHVVWIRTHPLKSISNRTAITTTILLEYVSASSAHLKNVLHIFACEVTKR